MHGQQNIKIYYHNFNNKLLFIYSSVYVKSGQKTLVYVSWIVHKM